MSFKNVLFSIVFILSSQNAISQEINSKLDELINEGNFEGAIQLSKGLLEDKPNDPILNFKIGYCYLNTVLKKSQAIAYLQKSVDIFEQSNSQNVLAIEAKFYLGKSYHKSYDFEKAIEVFQSMKAEVKNKEMLTAIEDEIQECNYGIQYKLHPINIQITNLGDSINSKYSDHSPVVTADESVLIFTSRRKQFEGEKAKPDGQYNEDIYISNFNGKNWSSPKGISTLINTEAHEASISLSPDGQQLLIYRDLEEGSILVSNLIGDKWSKPVSLGNNINTRYRETHATISTDNKHLYFTSDRPGGFGGLDIYQSDRQSDGSWGKAINLGPTINTAKDEEGPFIHPDGITLYFSSKGHETMGGFDIFTSKKNEFGTWSKAENLGYPVNTTEDDAFFNTTPDGKRAYFASYRDEGFGNTDIYMMGLPEAEEKPVTIVKGIVTACKSEIGNVQILIYDSANNEAVGIYKPNSITGKYLFILTRGKNYKAVYQMNDKEVHVENFHISDSADYQVIYKPIEMKTQKPCNEYVGIVNPIIKSFQDSDLYEDKNKSIIENILFKINNAEVSYFKTNLLKLTSYLKTNPTTKIEIIGYSDTQGPETYNLKLSKQRAQSVYDFITKHGVNPDQITYRGDGEKNQLTINNYKDGSYVWQSLPYNRRVEFKIQSDTTNQLIIKQINIPEVYLIEKGEIEKVNISEYDSIFTIQIGAFSKPVSGDYFKKLKNIQMYFTGNYYKYTYGEYNSEDKASNELKYIYNLGYTDAFIRRISYYFPKKLK